MEGLPVRGYVYLLKCASGRLARARSQSRLKAQRSSAELAKLARLVSWSPVPTRAPGTAPLVASGRSVYPAARDRIRLGKPGGDLLAAPDWLQLHLGRGRCHRSTHLRRRPVQGACQASPSPSRPAGVAGAGWLRWLTWE